MNENEVWKVVDGSTRYEVSNYGRVRDKKKDKLLDVYIERGHKYVYLALDIGGNRKRSVGLLVAQSFVPKPSFDCSKVKYKDGNCQNCTVDNVEWIPTKKSAQLRKSRRLAEATNYGYRQHAAGNPMEICVERECGNIRGYFHCEGDAAFFVGVSLGRFQKFLRGEVEVAGWRVVSAVV